MLLRAGSPCGGGKLVSEDYVGIDRYGGTGREERKLSHVSRDM